MQVPEAKKCLRNSECTKEKLHVVSTQKTPRRAMIVESTRKYRCKGNGGRTSEHKRRNQGSASREAAWNGYK